MQPKLAQVIKLSDPHKELNLILIGHGTASLGNAIFPPLTLSVLGLAHLRPRALGTRMIIKRRGCIRKKII